MVGYYSYASNIRDILLLNAGGNLIEFIEDYIREFRTNTNTFL